MQISKPRTLGYIHLANRSCLRLLPSALVCLCCILTIAESNANTSSLSTLSQSLPAARSVSTDQVSIQLAAQYTRQIQASLDAKDYAQVEALARSGLNLRVLEPLDRAFFQQSMLTAYLQTENYTQVERLVEDLLFESPQDTALLALRTKANYLLGNMPKTLQSAQIELDVLRDKGIKPPEGLLRIHAESARQLKDQKARLRGLKSWVQHYPNSESWSELIEASAQAGLFRASGDLHVYRLMLATEGFREAAEYLDASEIFTRKGFNLEAKAALDLAVRKGALPNTELAQAYREKRQQVNLLLEQSSLEASNAGSAFSGLMGNSADAKLVQGYLQVLAGDRAGGVHTMEEGMAAGQLKSPGLALLTFAEGLWFAGFKSEARVEFERLYADPQLASMAELWVLATP